MAKIKKETFLLSEDFRGDLLFPKLKDVTEKYKKTLKESNLLFHRKETLDIMLWAKREVISFGPYQKLTFFEISNRIYSDLVLLEAAAKIFEKKNIKSIQLNMGNKGGNDMTVIDESGEVIVGEAFNSAASFFPIKLRSELQKFADGKRGYIAFNETALDEKNVKIFHKKKKEYPNIEFITCDF